MDLQTERPPDWAWEFHGHRCPFMPIGYRMGVVAMRELHQERIRDHGAFALVEIGVGHPQTCMADGVMVATGCTFGKLLMERLGYGKMAFLLHAPGRGTVRVALRPEFQDELGKQEFFTYRKRGVEPSLIPVEVTDHAVEVVLAVTETAMLKVDRVPSFEFNRPKSSFSKTKCDRCREYVFDRYLRTVDGKPVCIPCSGMTETRLDVLRGVQ